MQHSRPGRISATNVAPARIVALGVECATIRLLGWIPNLTHLLFKDAKTGERKEFCVKLDSSAGSTASFIDGDLRVLHAS
jgi:hypothetical protein